MAGADGKTVDRSPAGDQGLDAVLVQVSAGENSRVREAATIQNGPHLARMFGQIPAIQPHSVNGNAPRPQAGGSATTLCAAASVS